MRGIISRSIISRNARATSGSRRAASRKVRRDPELSGPSHTVMTARTSRSGSDSSGPSSSRTRISAGLAVSAMAAPNSPRFEPKW